MDMRRMLPFLLIAFALLFIVPQLFRKSSSTALSTKGRGILTLDATNRLDAAEQAVFTSTGKYTGHLADLIAKDKVLGSEMTVPLDVTIDVSDSGTSYVARVNSDVFSVAAFRSGESPAVVSCRSLKSRVGVGCPTGTTSPITTTSTTTLPTTTTTSTTGTITPVTTTK